MTAANAGSWRGRGSKVTATGVLCARVRMEEKQIIAALGDAGMVAMPVPPASAPLPPDPASSLAALGRITEATAAESVDRSLSCIIDRAPNRAVAAATLPLLRGQGVQTIDAGLAATGNRLEVATALSHAGVPRPKSLAAFSEASGIQAAAELGFPSTLLGLTPGGATTHLHDHDTADAVIEHRVVLGNEAEAIFLLQAGAPDASARTRVHVVGGRAVAIEGVDADAKELDIAERAARALGASLVVIELARTGHTGTVEHGTVVWDIHPVSDFRNARQLGDESVAGAIASLAALIQANDDRLRPSSIEDASRNGWKATVGHGVVVSA